MVFWTASLRLAREIMSERDARGLEELEFPSTGGQSQFTDMAGGKPLGLTLDASIPPPDVILPDLAPLATLLQR